MTGTGSVFSGGADIREFNTPTALAEPNLLQLIDAVEGLTREGLEVIVGLPIAPAATAR